MLEGVVMIVGGCGYDCWRLWEVVVIGVQWELLAVKLLVITN